MIGYVTLGTNNLEKASEFYDALFATVGASRAFETDTFVAWGKSANAPAMSVTKPFDGERATVGNGVMVAIGVDSADKVDEFHAKALELGGSDEGTPGPRMDNFYAGYFRDLDGNKLNAFCIVQE